MANHPHFIVSHYIFAEHTTFEEAEKERKRLSEKFSNKTFKVYGITEEYQNIEMRDPKRKYKRKLFQDHPPKIKKITLANFKPKKQGTSPV